MKILFCHGIESGPNNPAVAHLREAGHEVIAPKLPKDDFEASVQIARKKIASSLPDVVGGVGRGAAVIMRLVGDSEVPLVLLAPAWRRYGVEPLIRRNTLVLHGIRDDVVPLRDSIELGQRNSLPQEGLMPVNDGHSLASPLALEALLRAVTLARAHARVESMLCHNQIKVIRPYMWEGIWVFDDPEVDLNKEPLVAGVPELIEIAAAQAGIRNPEKGFVALFSHGPFPTAQVCLEWVREEAGGNVYRWPEVGKEGWLCPALFRYFDEAPENLYVELRQLVPG